MLPEKAVPEAMAPEKKVPSKKKMAPCGLMRASDYSVNFSIRSPHIYCYNAYFAMKKRRATCHHPRSRYALLGNAMECTAVITPTVFAIHYSSNRMA